MPLIHDPCWCTPFEGRFRLSIGEPRGLRTTRPTWTYGLPGKPRPWVQPAERLHTTDPVEPVAPGCHAAGDRHLGDVLRNSDYNRRVAGGA
jgi:hypothetical protein